MSMHLKPHEIKTCKHCEAAVILVDAGGSEWMHLLVVDDGPNMAPRPGIRLETNCDLKAEVAKP